jgi:uncharacterized Fe-S center protein
VTCEVNTARRLGEALGERARRTVFRRGRNALAYAEKLGVGSRRYELVTLEQPGAVALAG